MDSGFQSQDRIPENMKKQLALAVRSIQWSYAIFWSISATQPGVLEWGDGYYNGDINIRKTIQSVELKTDQLGLQRSEQLRELFESLATGDSSPQARRPSAALSPEDLTDTEWYYLVCMSFVFNIGQGLPGRTLACGELVWLCNAPYADSKVFSRSLLAKSASIQTIVCFPYLGGVVELGVTEKVLEDISLIDHVKTSFLGAPCHVSLNQSNRGPFSGCGDLEMGSPDNSSDEFKTNMVEEMNGAANWLMEEEFSDCISQTILDQGNAVVVVPPNSLQEVQECNSTKLTSLDLQNDDLHYQNVLSSLLKTSHQLILGPNTQNTNQKSSFVCWTQSCSVKPRNGSSQNILKKILLEVPRMHDLELLESRENEVKNSAWRPEADEINSNHALTEKKRRGKINNQFSILKSLIPSISKDDKVSILDDTIQYLHGLEKRVEELESSYSAEVEPRAKTGPYDTVERTSDNYGDTRTRTRKKNSVNKRKARDLEENEPEIDFEAMGNCSNNVSVCVENNNVLIQIKCPWKEGILLEMMDAVSRLHLDCHSVQSSTNEGILSVTMKSKFKGVKVASEAMIKRALRMYDGKW